MRFLDGMWDVLDRELEPDPRSTPHTLELACYVLPSDVFVALVTMPPPQRVLEAFFVALVARLEGASAFARCFTLDLARAPSPGMTTPRGGDTHAPTGILEWDMRGQHTLVKESVAPEASCFVEAIERLIESDLAHA
jgi:hypothetical protein